VIFKKTFETYMAIISLARLRLGVIKKPHLHNSMQLKCCEMSRSFHLD